MTDALESYRSFLGAGDFSEVYVESSRALSIEFRDGSVETVSSGVQSGAGFRVLVGKETRFGFADRPSPFSAESAAIRNDRLVAGLNRRPVNGKFRFRAATHPVRLPPQTESLEKKMARFQRIDESARISPLIRQITLRYGEKEKEIGIINSEGDAIRESRVYSVFAVMVTAERDGLLQNAYESMGGLIGLEMFDGNAGEALARLVAERALNKLNAPPAPVGEMPVVIQACAGGTLIHEAIGHSLEADAVLEGTSPPYAGKVGKIVANPKLTVFDNPTLPGKRGSFFADDEGVPSEATKLIDAGVLKDYLFDRQSAKRAGRTSNGHGRRESYRHKPIPRMSNTYIAPGPDRPDEILKGFQNGLLVTRMGGGQVNTTNGDFVFDVEEGFHVRDGKKTMVRGATLLGNGPQVLLDIDQVGSDHGWGIGTCGKEGQGVPVSDAIPTIHIKKLVIGGSSQ